MPAILSRAHGNSTRDRLLAIVASGGKRGLTTTQIRARIGSHVGPRQVRVVLGQLADEGLIGRRDESAYVIRWLPASDVE